MVVNNIKGHIYKITNPSGKIYIGQTIDLKVRKNKYKYLNCKNKTRLYKSLLKYGWKNHTFEVLETIDIINDQDLDTLEIKYIKQYNCFIKGLNCTLGGQGGSGKAYSEESKLKMRNSQLGKKQSEETINKRIEKLKGQKRSIEFKEKIRSLKIGSVLSDETKKKLSEINKGKILSEETKTKISNSSKGRVVSEETRHKISQKKKERDLLKKLNEYNN
jgi:group I intron endonuclease